MSPFDRVKAAAAEFLKKHPVEMRLTPNGPAFWCPICGEDCQFRYETVDSLTSVASRNAK